MTPAGSPDPKILLRIAIEYAPKADLDALAATMADPTSAAHRAPLTLQAFADRFGRDGKDGDAMGAFLKSTGASDVFVSRERLMGSGILSIADAERAFKVKFVKYQSGSRTAIAPAGPLVIPLAGIRAVHGAVIATTPHLNDVPTYTLFRGDWYTPVRFREMYDALPSGGGNERIEVIEDASDRFDLKDIEPFLRAEGAPPGTTVAQVTDRVFSFKAPSSECGRDDRGQESALDADAALTMAPLASVVLDYDDVCSPGNDGTVALQRAVDNPDAPTVIVFPFTIGPALSTIDQSFGRPPLAMLEAVVRGIPIVAPAGDDGSFGYHIPGLDQAAVSYPCVSPYIICAGGTQLGDRDGFQDEAAWNDNEHATGGGISLEPRPVWQDAASAFEYSTNFVKNRIVPDVSADASGHLRVYWHNYGIGGIGGTSESAAIVGAQIAAINSVVPRIHRLSTTADLYVLAKNAPKAFRDVQRENDRGYTDNTLRPRRQPLPRGYRGMIPPAPKPVIGCAKITASGCGVRAGFDAVTGIGSLKEKTAADALR
jgi:subtilase family serine protease